MLMLVARDEPGHYGRLIVGKVVFLVVMAIVVGAAYFIWEAFPERRRALTKTLLGSGVVLIVPLAISVWTLWLDQASDSARWALIAGGGVGLLAILVGLKLLTLSRTER